MWSLVSSSMSTATFFSLASFNANRSVLALLSWSMILLLKFMSSKLLMSTINIKRGFDQVNKVWFTLGRASRRHDVCATLTNS